MPAITIGSGPTHRRVYRYLEVEEVTSALSPLEDAVSWISGLKSTAYTGGILAEVHGIQGSENSTSSSAVSALTSVSVEFLEQAMSGPQELSYLPTYYAMLNLAKVIVIARGMLARLDQERRHGASWPRIESPPSDILTDEICLWPTGAIPLMYTALTGSALVPAGSSPLHVSLAEIYPYLVTIGYEFGQAYPGQGKLAPVLAYQDVSERAPPRLHVQFAPEDVPKDDQIPLYPFLEGFSREGERLFSYPSVEEASGSSPDAIVARCRTYLLYDLPGAVSLPVAIGGFRGYHRGMFTNTWTPISGLPFLLPEELPILIAFFHLSNVVRYAPLHLKQLFDSRASGMLHTLLRHGTLRFLLLFWSFFNQRTYIVRP